MVCYKDPGCAAEQKEHLRKSQVFRQGQGEQSWRGRAGHTMPASCCSAVSSWVWAGVSIMVLLPAEIARLPLAQPIPQNRVSEVSLILQS